jgi:hypothetical protein
LALLLVPVAQAKPTLGQNVCARTSVLNSGVGLVQPARSNSRVLTSGKAIRVAVRNGFVAINAANKRLYACKWGHCTKAAKTLRKTAHDRLTVLHGMSSKSKTVARGLFAAITSLEYWVENGSDAVNVDAAAKAKNQSKFDHWYALYKNHYKLAVKYQNRAVSILKKG